MPEMQAEPSKDLRIACLLPSATAICVALGLEDNIVGVTHECQQLKSMSSVCILTENGLTVDSQGEIHQAISSASLPESCSIAEKDIPSFYPLLKDQFDLARPNVIFTQDLCAVCAPTPADVKKIIQCNDQDITIVSLHPTNLKEVADSFVTVAQTCGVAERGIEFREKWWSELERLQSTILKSRGSSLTSPPKLFILEWLDPPFDSGHWTYQMMDFACVETAKSNKELKRQSVKSKEIKWKEVYDAKPDVIVVGCCGFNLKRNVKDTIAHADKFAPLLENSATTRIFACDGNSYIAQPGPSLLQGVAVLAQCAYHDNPQVIKAIELLNILPPSEGFQLVDIKTNEQTASSVRDTSTLYQTSLGVGDVEDIVTDGGFAELHKQACLEGEATYDDPETGYKVFTELAHKKRGFCCGSGCRHCPFSHESVGDKAMKIQQPAILYQQSSDTDLFSLSLNSNVKVLFHSGGKDSFLTIRALVQAYRKKSPFGLVLLTTFDATSRNIAHQDVPIDDVVRQAQHLDITLLGVPLRRGSGETYLSRIRKGLDVIQANLPRTDSTITSLVFGDLHLDHIKAWRDKTFQDSGLNLEYPLWNVEYETLLDDLEESQVPCSISGTTVDVAKVGSSFDRQFYKASVDAKIDGFGEAGEFHSIAKVWEVERSVALG